MSLQEYMGFMISRQTENVQSSEEVESAFRALSSEGKPFVTKDELYQVASRIYCKQNKEANVYYIMGLGNSVVEIVTLTLIITPW